MSYFDSYKTRMNVSGSSIRDESKYFSKNLVNETFSDSMAYKQVEINSALVDAKVEFANSNHERQVFFKPDVVYDNGTVVSFDSHKWLILEYFPHELYPKAEVKMCNSIFPLKGDPVKTQIGTDSFGRPIYSTTDGTDLSQPCIVESRASYYKDNNSINLPENKIKITMPFVDNSKIEISYEFSMYGYTYKTTSVDKTMSIGDRGLLILHAERVVS